MYSVYIYTFNHKERAFCSGEQCKDASVAIEPRTGNTDSWVKDIEHNGKTQPYCGAIFDVTIENTGIDSISNWNLKIQIDKDCFINNAWCGTVEIHQKQEDKEVVQTLDLRNYKETDLKLKYFFSEQDLLIPLHKGDYLLYRPDYDSGEYPVNVENSKNVCQVVFGMIYYSQGKKPVSFDQYQMKYFLKKNYTQTVYFQVLCTLGFFWIICIIIFVTNQISMKKTIRRFQQDEKIIRQSIGVFIQFFEAKDDYTKGHSKRVAQYSQMIAEKMGYTQEQCRQIYYIGLMHDCGKIYIPDEILKKPGKLTAQEYEIIKSHTVKGAEMLKEFNSIEHIRDGVLYHHERYDGNGYPEGTAGEAIPLLSRIICVADSFDAMNSRRCYRDQLTKEYIIDELTKNSGKQFDPGVVEIFLDLIKEGKIEFSKES